MVLRFVFLYIAVLAFNCLSVSAKYPSNLPKCKYGDAECIKNAIEVIIKVGSNGIPEINLPSLNPIYHKSLKVTQNSSQAVTVTNTLSNVEVYGVETVKINRVVGFEKDPNKSKFEIYFTTQLFQIIGDYKMTGNILAFHIQGNGKCNITSYDNENVMKFKGKTVERNNKKYLVIKKLSFGVIPNGAYLHFTNLFGGDPLIGETLNNLINDNWKEIYNEMKKPLIAEVEKVFLGVLNNIFSSNAYSEFFDDTN